MGNGQLSILMCRQAEGGAVMGHKDQRDALTALLSTATLTATTLALEDTLTGDLKTDLAALHAQLMPCGDIVFHLFPPENPRALFLYQAGGTDLEKLMTRAGSLLDQNTGALPALRNVATYGDVVHTVLEGHPVFLQDGSKTAAVLPFASQPKSSTPEVERVIRGPHQAFTASFEGNLALLRSELPTPHLRVDLRAFGDRAPFRVALAYLEGLAPMSVRDEVWERLQRSRLPAVLDATQLGTALADDPLSPFPNVQATERVDMAAQATLGGRFVLLAQNSPTVLLLPTTLADLLSTSEDYYLPRFMGTFVRLLRYAAVLVTLAFEPLYIAVTAIHHELLPTPLALAVARSRAGVPLPVFAEVLVLALIIEILREAAIRLPKILSLTITIVGALVIGESVVRASLISAPVIVLVAFVALTSFVIPSYEAAISIRLLRFPAMVLAAILGLYGVTWYLLLLLAHMARLRSFGVAYTAPFSPAHPKFFSLVLRMPSASARSFFTPWRLWRQRA